MRKSVDLARNEIFRGKATKTSAGSMRPFGVIQNENNSALARHFLCIDGLDPAKEQSQCDTERRQKKTKCERASSSKYKVGKAECLEAGRHKSNAAILAAVLRESRPQQRFRIPRLDRRTVRRRDSRQDAALRLDLMPVRQGLIHRYFIDIFEVAADGHSHGDAGDAQAERF